MSLGHATLIICDAPQCLNHLVIAVSVTEDALAERIAQSAGWGITCEEPSGHFCPHCLEQVATADAMQFTPDEPARWNRSRSN